MTMYVCPICRRRILLDPLEVSEAYGIEASLTCSGGKPGSVWGHPKTQMKEQEVQVDGQQAADS